MKQVYWAWDETKPYFEIMDFFNVFRRTVAGMASLIILTLPILGQQSGISTDGTWDNYFSMVKGKLHNIQLNLSLMERAPIKKFPNLMLISYSYPCAEDGLPTPEMIRSAITTAHNFKDYLGRHCSGFFVGSIFGDCKWGDFFYLSDTIGLRDILSEGIKEFPFASEPHIDIQADPKWRIYSSALYPSEENMESMANQKVVFSLMEQGDKLEAARKVDHWLYFKKEKDLKACEAELKPQGFTVGGHQNNRGYPYPFGLQVSREDYVDLGSINEVSWGLKKTAEKYKGKYDGWETVVVK